MRQIKKGTNHLFFRYMSISRKNFINEHNDVILKHGFTWIGKFGKKINRVKVGEIFNEQNKGVLLIKSPKAEGGKYYICDVIGFSFDEPKDEVYPNYYHSEISKRDIDVWFKINRIIEITSGEVDAFICNSNNELIRETSDRTMTSYMFIKTTKTIEFGKEVQ